MLADGAVDYSVVGRFARRAMWQQRLQLEGLFECSDCMPSPVASEAQPARMMRAGSRVVQPLYANHRMHHVKREVNACFLVACGQLGRDDRCVHHCRPAGIH